ncbi:YlxR family protein [Nostocoides veronense]|uniref:YlxR family protein n=1 Tax=Nostocoides veronense TaxID=330836 RepID=UPI0031D97BD5
MGGTDRTGLRPPAVAPRTGPTRTCVGCRQTDSRSVLLRIVAGVDEQGHPALIPDPAGRLPGRGAWLHPGFDCLALAMKRRAFPRALRISEPLGEQRVTAYLRERDAEGNLTEQDRKRVHRDEQPMSTQK